MTEYQYYIHFEAGFNISKGNKTTQTVKSDKLRASIVYEARNIIGNRETLDVRSEITRNEA